MTKRPSSAAPAGKGCVWWAVVCFAWTLLIIGLARPPAAAVQLDAALPVLDQPVSDLARVIDDPSARALDRQSRALQAATSDVVVVVTVPSIAPYTDIREYAVKLFENHGRGIGPRGQDNGVLILLSVQERRVWIEVGYGLEQWITDGFAGETSRDMATEFRAGDYGAGLLRGTQRIVGRIAEGRQVTLTDARPPVVRRTPEIPLVAILAVFLCIVWLSRSAGGPGRSVRRWGRRSGWSGWSSGVGPFGGGGLGGGGWGGGGGFGGGFGGFGGGRSGGGGGGASW